MNQTIVLTIIANDQPGIVQKVSSVLHDHGGSWSESSMSHLAGRFAGILMAQLPERNVDPCKSALSALEAEGIQIIAKVGQDVGDEPSHAWRIELVGNDRPGIVNDITAVLAAHGVSVHTLETGVEGASMGGGSLFRAWARLVVPESCDVEELGQALEDLANDLMVDMNFET